MSKLWRQIIVPWAWNLLLLQWFIDPTWSSTFTHCTSWTASEAHLLGLVAGRTRRLIWMNTNLRVWRKRCERIMRPTPPNCVDLYFDSLSLPVVSMLELYSEGPGTCCRSLSPIKSKYGWICTVIMGCSFGPHCKASLFFTFLFTSIFIVVCWRGVLFAFRFTKSWSCLM